MIQEIIEAFCGEVQELFAQRPDVTVLRDTQFDDNETPSHTLPVVIIGLGDSPDMKQLSGGVTQAEWNWVIRAYFIDSNAELSPDQAFSTGSYEIIETIVNHFNFQNWLTQAFADVVTNYSFKLTYQDTVKANALQKEDGGIIPGYQIVYSSMAIDTRTAFVSYSNSTLQTIRQVPYRTKVFSVDPLNLSFVKAGESLVVDVTANTPWIVKAIPPWCTLNDYEGGATDQIILTAAANPGTVSRSGSMIISAPLSGINDITIAVIQLGI